MRFKNPFSSEAELAQLVREALELCGWEVHPERYGWDLFAVAREVCGLLPGDQLGCECKLDAGTAAGYASLLRQTVPAGRGSWYWPSLRRPEPRVPPRSRGPHYRLAVSPRVANRQLLEDWGVVVICPASRVFPGGDRYGEPTGWAAYDIEHLADRLTHGGVDAGAARHSPDEHYPEPEVRVEVEAGVPSPRSVSTWKVVAVRLMLRLRDGELLTSKDLGGHTKRFRDFNWIEWTGQKDGRLHLYGPGKGTRNFPPPDEQWPEIADALRQAEEGRK